MLDFLTYEQKEEIAQSLEGTSGFADDVSYYAEKFELTKKQAEELDLFYEDMVSEEFQLEQCECCGWWQFIGDGGGMCSECEEEAEEEDEEEDEE